MSVLVRFHRKRCLRYLLLVMCAHPFAKEALTLHLARSEGRERYFGCNLMHRRVLASSHQHLVAEAPSRTRWVPAETDPAGAECFGVPFAMAARARRVAAECPPWVRHWCSHARTRRRRARESELGGADPKVCSQARRRLARSKPSRTTLRPTLVSCGITGRSLFCAVKSSPMGASAGAQFAACSSSCSRFEPASRAYPSGPVARHPQPRGRKPALRREIPWILRGFQGRLSC